MWNATADGLHTVKAIRDYMDLFEDIKESNSIRN